MLGEIMYVFATFCYFVLKRNKKEREEIGWGIERNRHNRNNNHADVRKEQKIFGDGCKIVYLCRRKDKAAKTIKDA